MTASTTIATLWVALLVGPAEESAGPYLVFVDSGEEEAFLPAAEALAVLHGGEVIPFTPSSLEGVLEVSRKKKPLFVAFVLPPWKIDVDLAHEILALACRVDEDPFVDFEYGFITGRDGPAARKFVERIAAARKRTFRRKAALFGTWEGQLPPQPGAMTFFEKAGFDAEVRYVMARDEEPLRKKASRGALEALQGRDALLFFSHGYPHEMAGCFTARDLREWKVDLSPAILVNCACWNGAPGRWFAPGPDGPVDRGVVSPEDSVALEILDRGVTGYVAGIDPWHGPLALKVFARIVADGMRLGEAAKRMLDRLALEFHPDPIRFQPTLEHEERFSGEGVNNRRHNGAGMVLYGDPAFAPFKDVAVRPAFALWETSEGGGIRIRMGTRALIRETPGADFLIPMNRLIDYYSVRSADFQKELAMEIYRVVAVPKGTEDVPPLRVASARSGKYDVKTGPPQQVRESTPRGDFLHVRVPLKVPVYSMQGWPQHIAAHGLTVILEESPDTPSS